MSAAPAAPAAGETVDFTLGAAHCTGTTDANGFATCEIAVGGAGMKTLSASFTGTATTTGSSDTIGFTVTGLAVLGSFMAYATAVTKGTPKFDKFGPVTLGDGQFNFDASYDVLKPSLLAAPADVGSGVGDAVTHLEGYAVKLAKGSAKFQKRIDVAAVNECGSLLLTVAKPTTLLVPTAKNLSQPPTAPQESDHNVDHFLCYQAQTQKKRSDGTAVTPFPKGVQLDVIDQFQTRRYGLTKVASYCDPVTKSGAPIVLAGPSKGTHVMLTPADVRNRESHLVCYAAKLAKKRIEQNGWGPLDPADKGTKIVPPQAKTPAILG